MSRDGRRVWQNTDTNLIGVWVGVETQLQDDAIAQHQPELDLERSQERQQLTAAARAKESTGA